MKFLTVIFIVCNNIIINKDNSLLLNPGRGPDGVCIREVPLYLTSQG